MSFSDVVFSFPRIVFDKKIRAEKNLLDQLRQNPTYFVRVVSFTADFYWEFYLTSFTERQCSSHHVENNIHNKQSGFFAIHLVKATK